MIKKLLAAVGGIIIIIVVAIAVVSFTTPTDFKFGREVVINKPKAEVMDFVKHVKNQNEWGPWVKKDPNIKLTYKGTDGEPGYTIAWDSQMSDVGAGEQEIKTITDSSVKTELRFKRPMETVNYSDTTVTEVSPTQTKVRWELSGSMPRPFNIMMRLMDIDKEVGKDFEAGLATLKSTLEKQ